MGIIGSAWAGATYVPLGLAAPDERLIQQLAMLDLDALIVDRAGLRRLKQPLLDAAPPMVLFPVFDATESDIVSYLDPRLASGAVLEPPVETGPDHSAYIEFTSGTTGVPKGVVVRADAVANYLDVLQGWYGFTEADRAAETCDITFDLSIHNMLLTWAAGACLYHMRPSDLIMPTRFIQKHRITTWLSVPSLAAIAIKTNTLGRGALPSLRLSLFCGEPLPAAVAEQWAAAAPNSIVDNIYGPTEATIACTRQTWSVEPAVTAERGVVAIGHAFPGMKTAVLDDHHNPLPDGAPGEIALAGVQLADGYLSQPELTGERFPTLRGERWYLTGDLGRYDAKGRLHHLGRIDNQIKIRGHRVELEEVECHLRIAAGTQLVAAVAHNVTHGSAESIIGFCVNTDRPSDEIRKAMRDLAPEHMIPERIEFLSDLPLNANGKVDRNALARSLDRDAA